MQDFPSQKHVFLMIHKVKQKIITTISNIIVIKSVLILTLPVDRFDSVEQPNLAEVMVRGVEKSRTKETKKGKSLFLTCVCP